MLAGVLLALLAEVPFSLKPSGPPGRYELQLYADARARAVLTLSPPPPAVDGARAEVTLSADDEGGRWLVATLTRDAGRGAPTPGRTRLGGRWRGTTHIDLDGFSIGIDLKKSEGWFAIPPGTGAVALIEQALKPWPPRPTPLARLDAPTKVSGPGVRVVWAGRVGILFVEPGGAHRFWDPAKGTARSLGKRKTLAPLAACGGVCAIADPKVIVLPSETVELPTRTQSLWVSQDGRYVGGELDNATVERQQVWVYDRTKKRLTMWTGADDLAHLLRFKAWGSKGIVFARTAGCTDDDVPGADETSCLLELEPPMRLVSIGASRTRTGEATSPDKKFRLSTVAGSTVLETVEAGTRQVVNTPLIEQPVWLNDRVALTGTDPLTVLDTGGAVRSIIDDRIQFAGGQIDGAIVWYETTDGLFVARAVAQ